MAYERPSEKTISFEEWTVASADGTVITTTCTRRRFFGESTFSRMMGHEDFAVDLHKYEDEGHEKEEI